MTESISPSIQDYLKSIYSLSGSGEASTNALALRLGVAPASVTGMLQKLAALRPPLVHYQKHQGVTLTAAGEKAALEVIRHHRLLEAYLVESLGYSWDAVHEEACRLEHVISEDFEQRIAESLGHPERDPHGDPIPSANLSLPHDISSKLGEMRPGQSAVVQRVRSDDPALLRHLGALGLIPGAQVRALEHSPFDDNLTLEIASHGPVVLGPAITLNVFVEVAP
ncbi:MAG: metal-dependent transcriptional regulator [Chloroflexota bacterium]